MGVYILSVTDGYLPGEGEREKCKVHERTLFPGHDSPRRNPNLLQTIFHWDRPSSVGSGIWGHKASSRTRFYSQKSLGRFTLVTVAGSRTFASVIARAVLVAFAPLEDLDRHGFDGLEVVSLVRDALRIDQDLEFGYFFEAEEVAHIRC